MVNYNNSVIYKICCNDLNVSDIYVGSTTQFRRRKCEHKQYTKYENGKKYHMKLYETIRNNGGWSNWSMILLKYVNVNTKLELHKEEREMIDKLKPSLNGQIPLQTRKEYEEKNKERIKKRDAIKNKKYYENNKELIKQKIKVKITCECGASIRKDCKNKHYKTKKHINFILKLKPQQIIMDQPKDQPKKIKEVKEKIEKCLMITCNSKVCFC